MTPALSRTIPFFPYPQAFLAEEDQLVGIFRDVGRRGAFILQEDLRRFEENLARFLGARRAIGVANATDGLLIALLAAGVAPGTEVIFSSHTMVATAAAVHFAGAIPVPVDCGADHLMNAAAAGAAITPRTSAILPTQLNGRTADMDALGELASRHGLRLVEDAAQALGSRFRGRCAGTFGAAAAISFFPAKLLGCLGDGGAVIANGDDVAERVAALHDHGRDAHGNVTVWGFNSRLDNLQAAILDYRLRKYEAAIDRRRELAGIYDAALRGVAEVVLPPAPDADPDHFDVYQNYEIEAEWRDELREFLTARGIGTLLPWGGKAVHQFEALGFASWRLPVTERLFERVLLLPMHAWLLDEEVEMIAAAVRDFYRGAVMIFDTRRLIGLWETMTLIRRVEERIAKMVETGEIGCPCHLCIGQEAIAAGVCAVLEREDTVWGGHRSHGHYLAKGGSLAGLFGEVLLKLTGCAGGRGGSMHLAAPEVGIPGTVPIVAGTVPLAAGAAFAYTMRGETTVAVAFFGDGTLEEGHVHESMNLAALYRLPLVLICENNLYASHLHWTERRVADNLYRAGEFHSIPGERVDGNDVEAVEHAARVAVERARRGEGPTLIECRTFRWRGHVGASFDLDVGVERRGELSEWLPRDPLRRLADRLIERGITDLARREQEIDTRIDGAVEAARSAARPEASRVNEYVWGETACGR